ncbi:MULTISPECIES: type I-C CRISPR-associated protein Cas8c/Csd1 [Heyndrickxia]|uniref:type I-C CRISPR-associated protein Cas8c/Csd1 n=1 Tax=Heyndrickxia TaxID=2837504 RepID=UPI0023E35353|nr:MULTISPECIES: type I-C CRISPR-associated protein Cas8c/Csd1 [Heyndrickxia]MDT9756914.1 type I-C CRISPR-associated protein Cas8c/Csd1 [Heyndrickxia coagulans]MED4921670.1 type I-C CRISPR-associated protein Cas8c/Csd1 [Weizmannia sp. CD-2023]MED4966873.1 type I-C CRISPR-associated protein Cas8c/Csd1 [Heyndrickxia coagulans]
MSWLLNLYETYQANEEQVGKIEKKRNDQEYTLLPVSHTTQTAHLEVQVTEDGNFYYAEVINDKKDAITLIPCTEESSSRAGSKIAPYPLHDKLIYVAGDFVAYGGKIKKEEPFSYYIQQLGEWANSPFSNAKVQSIYAYLKKKQLIHDLVEAGILFLDNNGQLIDKWDSKYGDKPPLYSTVTGSVESAFVRFTVYSPEKILTKVWKDPEMYESFIKFYNQHLSDRDLCYVTGEFLPSTERHANKIRNSGDKAKLISANDSSGFTYRGRFTESKQVASISYKASQKAHNALKWLINKQGKIIDNRVFLVWENGGNEVPSVTEDSYDITSLDPFANGNNPKIAFTNQEFAREFSKAMDGYKSNLSTEASINILVLDSATTGRMAVLYYRNLNKEIYFENLVKWHTTCAWLHRYRKNEDNQPILFFGAPATKDIAFAAYGPNASDKVVKGLMERMLPCIVEGRRIPTDIVRSALRRASNPVALEKWEWEKILSIACALINKEEGYNLALDKENNNRDYLFGRLLAIADVLERNALDSGENRATNAIRYMNAFSQHPARTWGTIQASLQPYQVRLGKKGTYYAMLIDEVASKLKYEDFNDRPLSGKFLLGFYSQRYDLYQKKDTSTVGQTKE